MSDAQTQSGHPPVEPFGPGDPLLTSGEVARLFKVDPKTVTRWAAAGRIGFIRTPGKRLRYSRTEVDAMLGGGGRVVEGPR